MSERPPVCITQLPASLLHSGCIAKIAVCSVTSWLKPLQTHLSVISPPLGSAGSHHPKGGIGSVIVAAYSWLATIESPSSVPPALTKSLPHAVPASRMYGRFVYGSLLELCHAQ